MHRFCKELLLKKKKKKKKKRLSDIIVQKTQTYQIQELCYLEGVSEWRCVQVKGDTVNVDILEFCTEVTNIVHLLFFSLKSS